MSYENICNICGANYEYVNGRWMCPACGAYKAEELSNEEVTLLYNAAQKLRLADFDDAEQAYADIVQKYPLNHEGYWGRLLSKYGIKYEEDFDGKKIPTCYATTIESILGDSDYKRATELAPPDVREYYARQAEYIERVRKEWVDKASHEAPYDVFICYKDSDLANGIDRTQDSIAAQELYIHLVEQGYRVFFSRESLRDKVGEKYEPYIFNALSTAKVMLVYGTNPEFITSTWLKNEWTRYHKRILAGDKKQGSLVTICDGFAPSELPRLLSATQCFDATKRSFYSDLDKYVKKYTKEDEPAPVIVPAPASGSEAAESPAPAKKTLSKNQKTAIGAAAVAILIAVLMVIFIPILTRDPILDTFEIREGSGGMTYISGYIGDGNKAIIPEKIGEGTVVGIEARAFDGMDTLTLIIIPDSVTSIGANAFYGCTSVDTIVIPSSVTSMGMSAFYGWTNKQTVIILGKETAPSSWNDKWLEGCDAKIVYGKLYVTFDANGGRGKEPDIHTEIDSRITLPDGSILTRAGYTFIGWSLEQKSTTADFQPKAVYTVGKEQALTFYAVWSPNKNKVVFDANGGEGTMEVLEGYTDSRVELPYASFKREGYRFVGWATSSGASSPQYREGVYYTFGPSSSTILYAVWEPEPRNIHLSPNGGIGDVQTFYDVYAGHAFYLDKGQFTRQGYIFRGYSESPDGPLMYTPGTDFIVPEGMGDITLYAFWEPRNYNIRFHSNDENGKTVTVQVAFETTIDLPDPGFTREGYELIGWSTNNKVENMTVEYQVNGKYTHVKMGTLDLYAVWAPKTYTVSFLANHPSAGGVMDSLYITLGSEARLPACGFIYEGYMLDGWATTPDGEPVYDPEGLFKMTTPGDKTLYAVWKELEFTIQYELGNHGVNHTDNPKVYRESDGAITLKAPTREGYEFLGWFSDAEMTIPCNTIAADSIGEVTFWAKWHALPNTVIFDANGGEGSMSSVTAETDTVITLPLNTMTREDCTFMGWTTVLGGTEVEYADGAEFTMQSHGVTLHAVWKANTYTISYDFAGGELLGAVTEYSHLTNSFTLGVPTREGYEFIGWSGTGIDGIQRTVMISIGSKGDRSYTANWQAMSYTIDFERRYHWVEGSMNTVSAKFDEAVTLPKNAFVNYGYVFKGWSTSAGGDVVYTDGQTFIMVAENLVLYPVWELVTPGLQFNHNRVMGYTGTATEIVIPMYYGGVMVTAIADGVFRDKTNIKSIVLPQSITEIGENAFAGCTSLATISFAGTVHHVPLSAFINTAYYNDPANIVGGVFYFAGHLIGPIDLTISGNYVIPSGTKVIVADAFKNCTQLVTVFIPGSVEYIGSNAFQNCSALTIRCEVSDIPGTWEWNWNSSNRPVILSYHEEYTDESGVKYQLYPDGSAVVVGYTGKTTDLTLSLQGYVIKKIADGAFQDNGILKKIVLAPGLVEIGANAFSGCYNLVEIVWPEGLERIGENAFHACQRLTTITVTGDAANGAKGLTVTPIKTFPSSLIYIGPYAFSKCDSLRIAFVPASVQTIEYGVFTSSDNLVVYAQPESQPSGWNWFEATTRWGVDGVYCDAQNVVYALYADQTAKVMDYFGTATTVTVALDGYTVIEIALEAFYNVDTLTSITLPEGVTKIGINAFANCDGLKTIVLPSTLKEIGEQAFSECRALVSIKIPEGVTEIAAGVFNCCNGLLEVILPSTLTAIGENAFYNCYSLPEISLPAGLLSIDYYAFQSCQNLKSIFLPASIEKMGEQVFMHCGSLIIYANASSQPGAWHLKWNQSGFGAYGETFYYTVVWNYKAHLTADNGVTYIITNDNKAYVVSYEGTATELDLTLDGYTVVAIEPNAFENCLTLQKVILPEGIVKIAEFAFNNCPALTDIKLPSTLTTIGHHAFQSCQGLKAIDIPVGVTEIDEYAFWNSNNLTIYAGAASKPDGWSASWNNENRPVVWDVKEHLTADNGVIYIVRNDNTVVVSGYTGEPTELDLTLEGYIVTEIADMAFFNCDTLTKITIPNTVSKIGASAFCSCENLVSVSLSTSLTEIGEQAFGSCRKLSDITLYEGLVQIGAYAFEYCHALVGVTLPNTVTTIGEYAFRNCSKLTIIYIPASVTQINSDIFAECYVLSIYAAAESKPNNWNAFWNTYNRPVTWGVAGVHLDDQGVTYVLNNDKTATVVKYTGDAAEITLSVEGYTVTKIADNVFENNEKLKRVILLDGMLEIGYRAFYDSDIESITIPDSVTTIGAQAFSNCAKLSSAKLPANLTSLGYEAFSYCESLTEVHIPKGLQKIEYSTFYACRRLQTVTVEAGSILSEIGNNAFTGCERLESINLPSSLKTIGTHAFNDCNRLISIVIPEGVTSIGNAAFSNCERLESITLPGTLKTICESLFNNCDYLTSIVIPEGVTSIGNYAFNSCERLESVTLPSTLTSIGERAFQGCSALKSISIPAGVETISEGAFCSCSALTVLELAEGVKHIGKDAFRYCRALRSVVLPNSILTIGEYAFSDNDLNTVFIPVSVTEIDQYAFYGNSSLTIYASAASEPATWDSFWNYGNCPVVWGVFGIVTDAQGVVYRLMNDKTALVIGFIDKGVTDLVIGLEGYTVTEIGARAFATVALIKSVAISAGVTKIGENAFSMCSSLTNVTFPSTLVSIESYAFCDCINLTGVVLPEGVTKIGEYAFSMCSSLTNVTFPSTLVSIESYAFCNCTNLTGVVLPENLTTIGEHAFWHNKTNAIYIPASVTTIGSEAFGDYWANIKVYCKTTEIARPTGWVGNCFVNATIYYGIDGVYTDNQGLVYQLFDNNQTARLIGYTTEAETYVIPATVNGYTVTAIDRYIFQGNNTVKRLTIPSSVTIVEDSAFTDCAQLIVLTELTAKPDSWTGGWIYNCLGVAWGTFNVYVDEQGVAYALYSDNTAKVIGCPDGLTSITIPATVEGYAVTEIADRAFQNRSMITSITMPNGLLKIGDYAFASVHSLNNITLPDTLTHIGEYAFGYCNNVQKTIFIPASVTTIEENAFYDGCFSWIYTAHKSKPDGWNDYWNSNSGAQVAWDYEGFVTDSQGVTYLLHPDKTASVYSYNGSVKELTFFVEGYSIVEICDNVFSGHNEITKVTFPSTLKKIGNCAFDSCFKLTAIELPEGIETIGAGAFHWCTGLVSNELTIPASVKYIGGGAFFDSGVQTIYVKSPENTDWASDWSNTVSNVYWNYKDTYTDVQGVTYVLHNDNTATVWSYNGNATTLSFAVEGYTVTKIRARIFENNTTLTSVTLPEGLLEIGDYAFAQCSKLQSIKIPAGVTKIGSHVFYFCSNLQSVTLPEGIVEIGDRAFHECSKLQTINLPEGLTVIREYAFYWCTNLQSIVLPDSLTTIETFAFYNTGLTSLIIPANVTTIGHAAFHSITADKIYVKRAEATENYDYSWHNKADGNIIWNTKGLYTDTQGITYILFNDNTAHAISYSGNATALNFALDGYIVTKISSSLISNNNGEKITKLTLHEGLLVIESYAFWSCTKLEGLVIPASVTTIQYNVFQTEQVIYARVASRPEGWSDSWISHSENVVWNYKEHFVDSTYGITYILCNDNTAIAVSFDGSVKEVVIGVEGYTVTALGEDLFKNRTTLTKVTLPEGLIAIGDYAFSGCQRLKTVELPSTLQSVGRYAFTDCFGLVSLSFGAGLAEIGEYAFSNCTGLTSIGFGEGLTTIGAYAFYHCTALTSVTLPDSVKTINTCAFEDCIKLTSIDLPEGLTTIPHGCFRNCTALASVSLPSGLKSIESYAFDGCSKLTSMILPVGLERIDSYAFQLCSALQNVELPEGVTYIGWGVFQGCISLSDIIIPESVVTIESDAFWNCGSCIIFCRAVSQPSGWSPSWKSSDTMAIWNTKTFITDANGVTYVVRNDDTAVVIAYSGTSAELTLGIDGYIVTEIGDSVFRDKTTLTSVTISDGMQTIGRYAFYGCTNLVTVNLPATLQTIGEHAFFNCKKLASIELPQNLTSIGRYAFYECDALTAISIPEGVTELAYQVFYNCDALKTVILPSTLTIIRSYAFGSCVNLPSIIIPEGVTTIESEAFSNCQRITVYACSLAKPSGWSSNWISSDRPVIWDFKELVEKDGVTYAILNDDTAIVVSYSGTAEELTLGLDGVNVTRIEKRVFYQNNTLKKIVIPEGVEVIGAYAFYYCSNLKEVIFPATLKTIEEYAFAYTALETVDFNEGLTEIKEYAFQSTPLTRLTLPNGLQTIRYWAFGDCNSLTFVFVPADVSLIEQDAFANCYNLKLACVGNATKPGAWHVEWMYSGATVVWNVKEMITQDGVTYILFNDGTAIAYSYSGSAEELTLGVEGYTLTEITANAFYDCNTLKKIVIPEGVEVIGEGAFASCDLLSDVSLPSTLTWIGDRAFESSHSLCRVIIPARVDYVGTYAFLTNATRVIIFAGAATQRDDWGYGWHHDNTQVVWNFKEFMTVDGVTYAICNDQTAVVVEYSGTAEELLLAPDGYTVKEILAYAFSGNADLKKVVIADSVRLIGPEAFCGCSNLTEVSMPSSLEMIGPYAFSNTALAYVRLNDGLFEIGNSAFSNTRLSGLFIPSTVTYIGTWAFSNTNLKCVCIPSSVTFVGEYAFQNNPELHIYHSAEASATGSWGYYWSGEGSFTHSEVQFAMDSQGVIYQLLENNTASVIGFQYNGTNEIVIGLEGYTVTSIDRYAFAYSSITSVVIPEGVRAIGGFAFSHCGALRSVKLSSTVNSIYVEAFSYCNSLAEIVIPASVTLIETWAFYSENGIKFYAEAIEHPDQWQGSWCVGSYEVVWGYVPTPEDQA